MSILNRLFGKKQTGGDAMPVKAQKQEGGVIDTKAVQEATAILQEYKRGKANLENRVVSDELWWELRHWEDIRNSHKEQTADYPEPTSAWLFNTILNKHADAMDNYPEPVVLPRERSDEGSAKTLSSVLPTILEYNNFDDTYSYNWWEKLKHGTAVYGIFWNKEKENGLGDVDIRPIDLLNLFWEPGITDIQQSRNLFITQLVDNDLLEEQYPQLKTKVTGDAVNVAKYNYDDTVDTSKKSVVVDWYYKLRKDGRTVLHYVKYVNDTVLYATQNDAATAETGLYNHGLYPIVADNMFPEKGTPIGFGYVAICKNPQLYVDSLSANILESSMMGTKRRFFASKSLNINKEQFMDWNDPIVEVEGEISDQRIREITVNPTSPVYLSVMQQKIEEMKDTAANRDVNSGGGAAGVTAAAAIAALQEAGNKASRDMISASYRAYTNIVEQVIELLRQFYTETRSFRITGEAPGQYEFVDVNAAAFNEQSAGIGADGQELFRKPVFDLKIKAQKKNPFSRMEQNERAKELYGLGFFNPERAQEALGALEMMDFEGIDKVREQVNMGATLLNIVQQQSAQLDKLMAVVSAMTGTNLAGGAQMPLEPSVSPMQASNGASAENAANGFASGVMEAQTPMTGYGERLAKRSTPDMNGGNSGNTAPGL